MAKTVNRKINKRIRGLINKTNNISARLQTPNYFNESDDTQVIDAAIERLRAKKEGRKAGVLIAKARKAKVKKAKLTAIAQELNFVSKEERSRARGLTKYLAYDTGMYTTDKNGKKRYFKKRALENQALKKASGRKTNPIFDTIQKVNRSAELNAQSSKAAARQSGGTATGIKRTAEAALGRIATGKALKSAARKAGVLGIVGMFLNEINSKKGKG